MDDSPTQARLLDDVTQLGQLVREGVNYARSAHVALGEAVRVDLQAFLGSVVDDYQDVGRAVQLGDTVAASAPTHPQVLRRVVQNLVDNALAYAGDAETALRRQADGRICIDVLDRGPGIPEDALAAVLQPFHRLEPSRGRDSGGTGLGLAIAQQLAQALGGELVLANRDGGGLRATLMLPAAA
jgi:signal transduction histidine kinase